MKIGHGTSAIARLALPTGRLTKDRPTEDGSLAIHAAVLDALVSLVVN